MTEQPFHDETIAEDVPLTPVVEPGPSDADSGPQDNYVEEDGHGVPV